METDPAIGPRPKLFGRPPRYAKRAILDAIFYVVRSGCAWRLLPHDLPPWRMVYYYLMMWPREGLWQRIHDTLRERVRLQSEKKPRPLRSSIRRALMHLTTEACAAALSEVERVLARRSWDQSDLSWWTRLV